MKNYVKYLYTRRYKILLREIKDLSKWRDITCSWTGRLKFFKLVIPPRLMERFRANPTNIRFVFVEINKLILNCIWKWKEHSINFEKENVTLLILKLTIKLQLSRQNGVGVRTGL